MLRASTLRSLPPKLKKTSDFRMIRRFNLLFWLVVLNINKTNESKTEFNKALNSKHANFDRKPDVVVLPDQTAGPQLSLVPKVSHLTAPGRLLACLMRQDERPWERG